jgi:hypothetical protein
MDMMRAQIEDGAASSTTVVDPELIVRSSTSRLI